MGRFGDNPHAFFGGVYGNTAPWEIGGAQPAMAALLADFPPVGPILDLGSATGDLAIHLARSGYQVIGLEFIESAVVQSRAKAAALPAAVGNLLTFQIGDATRPSEIKIPLGAVVDSGFLHLLDQEETGRFVADLRRALPSGARYYLHEFAIEFPMANVPRAITRSELEQRFNEQTGWKILAIREVDFLNRVAQPTAAIAACIERL